MSRDRVCETAGCPSVSIRAYWVAEVPWSLPRFLGTVRLITTLAVVAAIGALAVGTTSPLLNPYQYDAAAKHQLAGIAAPAHNAMVPLFPRPASIAPTPPFLAAEGGEAALPRFTQTTASGVFRNGPLAGRSIGDVAGDLRAGSISPADLPVDVISRDGNLLGLNTRSMLALRRAGISPSDWTMVDRTGQDAFEQLLEERLARNGLTNAGTDALRITGAGQWASWLG